MSSGESDSYYISKRLTCKHRNTGFHYDNPRRFTCLDCYQKFVDYGKGWEEEKTSQIPDEE